MAKKPKKDQTPTPEPKDTKSKKKNSKTDPPPQDGPAKPQRGLAIGDNFGWTGKLPATLLYEHCQKQKWNKVVFDMRKTSKGFIGIADLSWENPKTKEVVHVKMSPETDLLPPRETTNEARHFAATYTMYRLNYVKNLKMVLPTIFRDYWSDLEKRRLETLKKSKAEHDRYYNPNPFQVVLDERAEKEAKQKERQIRENNEAKVKKPSASIAIVGTKTQDRKSQLALKVTKPKIAKQFPTIGRKAWENAPFVDFPTDVRASIETSIKHHIKWVEETAHKSENAAEWLSQLVSIGFRQLHVEEALSYTHTFTDALEWLLFHIPEDDLPMFFTKRDEDSGVSLKISTNIQTEYLLQRLSLSGFDKDEIQSTLLDNNGDEVLTSIALTNKIIDYTPKPTSPQGDEFDMWLMELEGIEAVGSNKVEFTDGSRKVASILLNVPGVAPGMLLVKLFFSETYPVNFPGIFLVVNNQSFKLANYIKLSILRQLLTYVDENNLLGECFLYSIVEWLEQNIARVIEHPGPLSLLGTSDKEEKAKTSTNVQLKKVKNKGRSIVLLQAEIDSMRKEYNEHKGSSALKDSLARRAKLPAWKKREQLVQVINCNKVTLVTGETGSGKSTQIVQFILDDLNSRDNFTGTIICTQPRRISTIGLAERISEERILTVGSDVGYIIRGENKTLKKTRLLFVTTGVLLRMLQTFLASKDDNDTLFTNLEYIFIDEVHERSVDSDFLLIILKKIMNKFPKLKIVLMSATINTETFMNFFSTPVNHIHIEGRTFPIEDHYLDSILENLDYSITTYEGQIIKPKADSHFFKSGTLSYELISQLCVYVDDKLTSERNTGSILIFLPGIMEINKCIRAVEKEFLKSDSSCWCLPLHSALSSKDQTKVFRNPPRGSRKIVVSTNIAETSITIPDCVVVIDGGRSKSVFFDSRANTTRLVENWCSRAEMAQRRGRSGRIQNGTCYHLYTKETETGTLAQPIPEIRRTRLENLFLVVKAMGINKVEDFLNSGLDPPEAQSLSKARSMLGEIGALTIDEESEKLTHLGKYLSFIPTDLQSGKLLLLGCIFGCVEICLTIAAVCSSGSPFLRNFDVKDEVNKAKFALGRNQGDLLAAAFAFHEWESSPRESRKKFIADNHLSYLTLQDIQSTRAQYLLTLKEIGFVTFGYSADRKNRYNENNSNYTIVRAIITGSFTPQLARVQLPDPKYAQTLVGAVEIDPDAKLTKFWIRNEKYIEQANSGGPIEELPATRAFIHPSSMLFSTNSGAVNIPDLEDLTLEDGSVDLQKARENFDLSPSVNFNSNAMHKAPFVVYTSSNQTSKLFLRDITPTSTLAALLFGGDILYDLGSITTGKKCPGIVLDQWMPIRTWCKNGVLLKRLRVLLDQVIENKLSSPEVEKAQGDDDEILKIVANVLTVEVKLR
ncbi:CIC11C00000004207 [Sungouiella intermedia]|uniref:CIC11C00000004207 n=1 Tax=Sungouiella intermedia TaxID=45354 RepID=A0A1L0CZA3_9ASCO|nr:CIC11C00000004207 [[Candida] intermedia]